MREQYIAGRLTLEQFEHDLGAAIRLDEGILPDRDEIPHYLRARDGLYLIQAPPIGDRHEGMRPVQIQRSLPRVHRT